MGGLFLSGVEAEKYTNCVYQLFSIINENLISRVTVESYFRDAVLKSLDITNKQDGIAFETRLRNALKELENKIKTKPIPYNVYYQIQGLSEDGLPFKFGNVNFIKFNNFQMNKIKNIFKNSVNYQSIVDMINNSTILNKIIALVEVEANDSITAKKNALRELSSTIDIINFYIHLMSNETKSFIYLPGEFESINITIPIITKTEKPTLNWGQTIVGPSIPFSIKDLIAFDKNRKTHFRNASKLLINSKNEYQNRKVSALQWAGKAFTEKNKEKSFLLFMIALESLVLLDNETAELKYRLSLRVAHLLGNNQTNRKAIYEKMGSLYNTRSHIVHRGNYQVSDTDLYNLRIYTISSILRIMNKRPFLKMTNKDQLVNWFNDQILF